MCTQFNLSVNYSKFYEILCQSMQIGVTFPLYVRDVLSLEPFLDQMPILGFYANSADPVQMPLNVVSDQGLHCMLTKYIKSENPLETLKTTNGLFQVIRMDKSTGQKRDKDGKMMLFLNVCFLKLTLLVLFSIIAQFSCRCNLPQLTQLSNIGN